MDEFVYGICRFIRSNKLLEPGEKVLAGVSGGADSTALLLVLDELKEELGIEVTAVHVEHGIRGAESLEDEAFVRELCAKRGIPFMSEHVSVPELRAGSGESLEEAARNARYEAFEKIRIRTGADKTALAHHAGDQTETVLLNLCRGTGLAGLAGMSPLRGRIIRPLLGVTRSDIEQWLESRGQAWRTDSTNLEKEQTRNRMRIDVLPLLEREINPAAARHIREASDIVRAAGEHIEREIDSLEKELVRASGSPHCKMTVSCRDIAGLDEVLQSGLIRRMIFRLRGGVGLKDVSKRHVDSVLSLAGKGGGKRIALPGGLEALRERDDLCLLIREAGPERNASRAGVSFPDEDGEVLFGDLSAKITYLEGEALDALKEGPVPEKKYTKWLACDTINHVICLRTRQPGDYLIINAAGQKKSLSDYMIDEKIPSGQRDFIPVAAAGSHILWVIGYRISYGARVTGETRRAVCIAVKEEEMQTGA